ncbi:hypothetical protein H6G74_28445 [Nostoc spongiaeforme FACHB-130]|uniref:Uncharacterized protein n=1 Tax=Nostoc spongiaeforme FACHB-130 TaxID=1357510 RepID=A0ABR8G523_9NOSO|nr:hypothetical protein [Nostoc spongiaeforme]MBD2598225.1 hypothetical protein [Nostoc spongiaeforme FACHB-130]
MLLPIAFVDEEINQIYILYNDLENIINKYSLLNKLILKLNEIGTIKYSVGTEMLEAMLKKEKKII